MKHIVIASTCVLVAFPAVAMKAPEPVKGGDTHVCNVVYDPNDVVPIQAVVGDSITVRVAEKERIQDPNLSDTKHVSGFVFENSNAFTIKASAPVPPQPGQFRTLREDGTPRDYILQFEAVMPVEPGQPGQGEPKIASNGPVSVADMFAKPKGSPCYLIRYQYPKEVSAEQAAKWQAQQARWKADQAEIALHRAAMNTAARNVKYVMMGDQQIAPTEIFDDGNTTEMHFPGNMPLPTIYTLLPDGSERVASLTHEDNGVVKLHGTAQTIRARYGELALCMFNLAWNPIGTNPGTGTSSPDIRRVVGSYQ